MGIRWGARGEVLELVDHASTPAPSPSSPTETEARATEAREFDAFYRQEFPRLLVLARAMAGAAMADDVAQEAMLAAYRRWGEVSTMASPGGWVRSVCLKKAVSVARRRGIEQRVLRRVGSFRTVVPTDVAEEERFWSLVRLLPLRQGQVVALYYAVDLSVEEIATTLGCAEGTVKAHLSRARAALATLLGVDEEDER